MTADIYMKLGATGVATTLTPTTLGSSGGTPSSPPYPLGSSGATSLAETANLVHPIIGGGVPA
jgi:hypothetical protein